QEILTTGSDYVVLDLTANTAQQIAARFPKIYSTCVAYGIDPAHEPIPVSPAEHYMMGGIRTDLHGATNVYGLLACGECACTGVHGANRLASNSMLEGLVFGIRTVEGAIAVSKSGCPPELNTRSGDGVRAQPFSEAEITAARTRLQETMWHYVGLVRSGAGLRQALNILNELQERYGQPNPTRPSIELSNMITVAQLVARAALEREESRGAHYRTDFPQTLDGDWQHHVLLSNERNQLKVDKAPCS
ncbi:MAG: FAD-binding protein, partial [Abitibacteriaceae bacterium]|nr:FAD-binding protein [Abditibacteriaceae bacterium]